MSNSKHIVIIGATSSIAENCARVWATRGITRFTLVARNFEKLERVKKDLLARFPKIDITLLAANFLDPVAISNLVDNICSSDPIDVALIAHGELPNQSRCEIDLAKCYQALELNAISPVLFAEAFIGYMQKRNHGQLALIGSVAGDRGRKSNYIYGAAKGLVDRYAQGLQHRLALVKSEVTVTLLKPGPTDTPMTAHLKSQGTKLTPVEQVAQQIVDGIASKGQTVYTPKKWYFIMIIIRHLPFLLFKRMDI